MFRRIYRVFAITGTLTFVLGWAAILYLAINPSRYAEEVGRPWTETMLGYGTALMITVAAQWLVAAFAYWRSQLEPN